MGIPIVMIHRGADPFLAYTLRQAKQSNPESEIILIGKQANLAFCSGIATHAMVDEFMDGANEFAKHYQHLSTNSHEYNLFCFQRWFILLDYMRRRRIQRCWYLDSDVMLYTDVSKDEYKDFAFEFSWTSSVPQELLEQFCSLILQQFREPARFAELVQYTQDIGQVYNGQPLVSDMVLCHRFAHERTGETQSYGIFSNCFFDGNINHGMRIPPQGDEVETIGEKKKIFFIEGQFYCKAKNRYIRANSLHFQGPQMKQYLPFFFSDNIKSGKETLYFDYDNKRWVPVLY